MSARPTPRMGRQTMRVSTDQYGAFFTGMYLGKRDSALTDARYADSGNREACIRLAKHFHREMMRCLREYRREQRMQECT
jgi:hypothetical protein